jgi:hypothetical protein
MSGLEIFGAIIIGVLVSSAISLAINLVCAIFDTKSAVKRIENLFESKKEEQ